MPRRGGFTMVELVLVLILLGILAGVAAPRFFALRGFQSDYYYDDVLSALRYAQRLAVASGCPVEFRITGGNFSLTQRQSCTTGSFSRAVPHPGTGAPGYTGTAPSGLSVVAVPNPVVFDPLGRALDGSLNPSDVNVLVGSRSIDVAAESGFAYDPSS